MSLTMLIGVLRMPPELWDGSELDKFQRHSRYIEAADTIERMEAVLADKDALIKSLYEHLKDKDVLF